jgi:hypothetical protein
MAVGQVQLYNHCFERLCQNADVQWDVTTAGNWCWLLATSSYTPADTHTTVNDLGANYITAGSDGGPLERGSTSVAIDNSSGVIQFKAGNANFGSNVTITAKYLIACQGDPSAITTSDIILFYQDLDDTGGSAQSSSSDFVVNAPANNIWFQINAQA